jgi:GNAT superfamily N-acetyltransferase
MMPKQTAETVMKMSARWVWEDIKLAEPSKMNFNIMHRSAQPSDRDVIVDFQLAMARETEDVALDREVCTCGVAAVFADPALGRYFVAENDGRVVASLLVTNEWSDWRNGVVWWIQSVYVVPEARGRRVYAGLYEHVKQLAAADANIRGIRLYVDRRNTSAQQVYTRLGMNGEHYQVFEWMKG